MNSIKIEDIMVDTVISYAIGIGYPAVGILSADKNPNRFRDGFKKRLVQKRYDQTAVRKNFQPTQNGIYLLTLNT